MRNVGRPNLIPALEFKQLIRNMFICFHLDVLIYKSGHSCVSPFQIDFFTCAEGATGLDWVTSCCQKMLMTDRKWLRRGCRSGRNGFSWIGWCTAELEQVPVSRPLAKSWLWSCDMTEICCIGSSWDSPDLKLIRWKLRHKLTIGNGRLPVGFIDLCEPILIENHWSQPAGVCFRGRRRAISARRLSKQTWCTWTLPTFSFSLQFGEFSNMCQPSNKQFTVTVRNEKGNNPSRVNTQRCSGPNNKPDWQRFSSAPNKRPGSCSAPRPAHAWAARRRSARVWNQLVDLSTLQSQLSASRSPAVAFFVLLFYFLLPFLFFFFF